MPASAPAGASEEPRLWEDLAPQMYTDLFFIHYFWSELREILKADKFEIVKYLNNQTGFKKQKTTGYRWYPKYNILACSARRQKWR